MDDASSMSLSTTQIPTTCKALVQEVRVLLVMTARLTTDDCNTRTKASSSRKSLSQNWAITKY